ncbi:MAG: RnfABCDGE type electron transport complex subunit D [Treponema sp.]|jgi:electron transport complex protein RnfD|nr:RnfABCDGE type electron transport complex subunit D [Treponema sp.]
MVGTSIGIVHRPQINLSRSTASRMWLVSCCALLGIIQSALTDQGASLVIAVSAVVSAIVIDLLIHIKSKNFSIRNGSTITTALIFTLLMPNTIHPVIVVIGIAFALLIIKHSFGGLGANWMNPAAGAWLFVIACWPILFNEAFKEMPLYIINDAIGRNITDPQGSPMNILKLAGFSGTAQDVSVTSMLNSTLFWLFGSKLPDGYIDLFIHRGSGIIADRGLLALLAGSILLAASQISRFWISAVYLGVYAILVRLFGALPFGGSFGSGDVLFGLLSGGVIAAAFILLTDPATGPKSAIGSAFAAIAAGYFTFVFRYQALLPYGAFFAILLLNVLTPLIRRIESRCLYENRRKK